MDRHETTIAYEWSLLSRFERDEYIRKASELYASVQHNLPQFVSGETEEEQIFSIALKIFTSEIKEVVARRINGERNPYKL